MSRELLGIGAIALVCLIAAPFFKQTTFREIAPKKEEVAPLQHGITVTAKHPKTIVLISDSFPPKTFAGSELSNYETLKYLKSRGHIVRVYIRELIAPEYNGIPLLKFNPENEQFKQDIQNCDILVNSIFDEEEVLNLLRGRKKPTYVFIHVVNSFGWVLQQKVPFPVVIVFNSKMTHEEQPTIHPNFIMYPYVDLKPYKELRAQTIHNSAVGLINCNKNKGGDMLISLARKMPNTQFIGIKGGYAAQAVDESLPNLTYLEHQKDIKVALRKIGILIMPSRNETWGRTAVEAMAAGIPVIHSEAKGLVECVNGAGIMCVHNDESAWAEAIERINRDPALREQLRQRGFRRVEEIDVLQKHGQQELARRIESH